MPQVKTKDEDDFDKGWTPVQKADGTYCSPRCGCNCTKLEYNKAVRDAEALAKSLGPGWKTRVWENCGWHWEVQFGEPVRDHLSALVEIKQSKSIDPKQPKEYQCWIQSTPQFISDWLPTAQLALEAAFRMADKHYEAVSLQHAIIESELKRIQS